MGRQSCKDSVFKSSIAISSVFGVGISKSVSVGSSSIMSSGEYLKDAAVFSRMEIGEAKSAMQPGKLSDALLSCVWLVV